LCGNKRHSGEWTKAEEEKLKNAVAECVESLHQALEERLAKEGSLPYNHKDEQELQQKISWTVVSEKMGNTRSRLQCQYKWKKLGMGLDFAANRAAEPSSAAWPDEPKPKTKKGAWRTTKAIANTARWLPGDFYHLLKA
jgi:hypothetical protein